MTILAQKTLRALALGCALLLTTAELWAQAELMVYDFTLTGTPAENVDEVRELGFVGLVTRLKDPVDLAKLDAYAEHVTSLDDFRLLAYVAYDFSDPASPDIWRQALPTLAAQGAPLWVVVKKAPSQAAIRQLLGTMARESQALGVRAVVYPHWNTSIETAAEAAALIAEVGHPNLRNSLHTCHEIRGGHQDRLDAVVPPHADQTALVAIAGADEDAYAGPPSLLVNWSDVIKPLDKGDDSLLPFLQALEDADYDAPVILQTFGITGDPGHLQRSIRAYAEYRSQITSAVVPAPRGSP